MINRATAPGTRTTTTLEGVSIARGPKSRLAKKINLERRQKKPVREHAGPNRVDMLRRNDRLPNRREKCDGMVSFEVCVGSSALPNDDKLRR